MTGPVRPSDAKLRRAQSLAAQSDTALRIARELIDKKLAGQEMAQPLAIAHHGRVIQMQAQPECRQRFRRGIAAENAAGHIAWQDFEHQKNNQGNEKERQDREQNSLSDEAQELHRLGDLSQPAVELSRPAGCGDCPGSADGSRGRFAYWQLMSWNFRLKFWARGV